MLKKTIAVAILLAISSPTFATVEENQDLNASTIRKSSKRDLDKAKNYSKSLTASQIALDDDSETESEPTRAQKFVSAARYAYSYVESAFSSIWTKIRGIFSVS